MKELAAAVCELFSTTAVPLITPPYHTPRETIHAENRNQDRGTMQQNFANTNCYVQEPLHFTYHPKCGGSTTHLQLFLRISFNGHTVDDINSSVYHQINNPSRNSQDYVCTDAQARSAALLVVAIYRWTEVPITGLLRPHAYQVGEGGQLKLLDLAGRHLARVERQRAQVLQRPQMVETGVGHPGARQVQRDQSGQACDKDM